MKIRFWNPGYAYNKIRDEIRDEDDRVLSQGQLILRKDVEDFEANLAQYVGTKYAVAVASGTDALLLSLKILGIGQGDEVITTAYTFRATVEAIHHVGATPVLVDLDDDWKKHITHRTKAVIPAHLEGRTLIWEPEPGIHMVEDACQAIGAKPQTGVFACYSFYPAKILGCYGDGGAITTNDEKLYEELKIMRNHYKGDWKPYGFNSRLDNREAAALNVKMRYLPEYIARRKDIARRYDNGLKGVITPEPREVYQDYVIVTRERDQLYEFLAEKGVETMKNEYPFPAELVKGPKTRFYESNSLRIPCNPELTDMEVDYVIKCINSYGDLR